MARKKSHVCLEGYCKLCNDNAARNLTYATDADARERRKATSMKYRKANSEKVKAKDRVRATKRDKGNVLVRNRYMYSLDLEKSRQYGREKYARNKHHGTYTANTAKRRAKRMQATPAWLTDSDFAEITKLYSERQAGFHVDHIVPLQGRNVCGLHVPWNLRIITAEENLKKSNKL